MARNSSSGKMWNPFCMLRLDRVLFDAESSTGRPPLLPGYRRQLDHFVRPQGAMPAYQRLQKLENRKTGSVVGVQYHCLLPWLRGVKVTLTAGDSNELSRAELEEVFKAFERPLLLQFELAFDFSLSSGVDRRIVRAHGHFGKSRPVGGNLYATLNYGTHDSPSFVRCYDKPELQCYRVEIQLHSSWLRGKNIQKPSDICRAAEMIVRSRFRFVQFDFDRLHSHLSRTKGMHDADAIVEQVRSRSHALHRALSYLRKNARVQNGHRFLKPVGHFNGEIRSAFCDWKRRWGCRNAL